jgi:hypothetical protein
VREVLVHRCWSRGQWVLKLMNRKMMYVLVVMIVL